MAYIEKYLNTDLATGANDGSSEVDAWQSWDDMLWAHGTRVNVKETSVPFLFVDTFTPPALTAVDGVTNMVIRGYTDTPGDGGRVTVEFGSNKRLNLNDDCRNVTFENIHFLGSAPFSAIVETSTNAKPVFLNCVFENLSTSSNSSSSAAILRKSIVINCRAISHGTTAPVLLLSSCTAIGCKVTAVSSHGIQVDVGHDTTLLKSAEVTNSGTATNGLYLTGGSVANINHIDGCTIDGFDNGVRTDNLPTIGADAALWLHGNLITNCTNGYVCDSPEGRAAGWSILNPAFYNIGHDDSYVQFTETSRLAFPSGGSDSLKGIFSIALSKTSDTVDQHIVDANFTRFNIFLRKNGGIFVYFKTNAGANIFAISTEAGLLTKASGPQVLTLAWDVTIGKLYGYLGHRQVLDRDSLLGPTDAVSANHGMDIGGYGSGPLTAKIKNIYFANTHSFDLTGGMDTADLSLFAAPDGRPTDLSGTPPAVFKVTGNAAAYAAGTNTGTAGSATASGSFTDSSVQGESNFPNNGFWPLHGKTVVCIADPYQDAASGDYALNNHTGGGAALTGGVPLFGKMHNSQAAYGAHQGQEAVVVPPADPVVSTAACLLPL